MRAQRWAGLAAALAVAAPAAAIAQDAAPTATAGEVTIAGSRRIGFVSSVNGRRYAISVALPAAPAPSAGYPVVYVLDGDGYFGSFVEATRTNRNAAGVVVVAVGYPRDAAWAREALARRAPLSPMLAALPPIDAAAVLERMYDMTLSASDAFLAGQAVSGLLVPRAPDVGGLDAFLKTIEADVKPRVAALARIDPNAQTLFGHSLGGLAVIRALMTTPRAYRTYVAASPSIWWADRAVLASEPAFTAQVTAGAIAPRILLTVGGDEEIPGRMPPGSGISQARIDELTRAARMTDNARELTQRLQALKGAPGYRVEDLAIFPHQGHGLSPWPSIGRAVAFAFQPGR